MLEVIESVIFFFSVWTIIYNTLNFMKIIFLRHAESTNNAIEKNITKEEYSKLRSADPPLSESGIKQVNSIISQITLPHTSAKTKYG
jgi:hypothetical protein